MNRKELEKMIKKIGQEIQDQTATLFKIGEVVMDVEEKLFDVEDRIDAYESKGKVAPDNLLKARSVFENELLSLDQTLENIEKELVEKHQKFTKANDMLADMMTKSVDEKLEEQKAKLQEQNNKFNNKIKNLFKRK